MKFVFPTPEYEQRANAFIQEFYDHGSEINGTGALDYYLRESTYAEWLKKVLRDIDLANIPAGRVPGYTYFYVREDDGVIVGMANIRLALNDFLRREGGHIGYSIRPTERRKGYGTSMLRGALDFLKIIGLNEIIVTCDRDNAASAGVIKNCGGILDAEFYSENFKCDVLRYKIIT